MIEAIYVSTERRQPMVARQEVELRTGSGIVGDRHFGRADWPGQNLTLVEAEEIERFSAETGVALAQDATRRNIVTRGVRLNDLVGREFAIGDVRLYGVELCEPCSTLGKLLATDELSPPSVVRAFVHRAGLRADVVSDGVIATGMKLLPGGRRAAADGG